MPRAAADDLRSVITQVRLTGQATGMVKTLGGFRKGMHRVPDAITPAAQSFLAKLCVPELTETAEDFFQRVRATMNYKRRELMLEISPPNAVLTAKDFMLEWAFDFVEGESASWRRVTTLREVRRGELVRAPEFDGLFAGQFEAIEFALSKGVQVEAVIDAVEELDGQGGLQVDYPSDCRRCTLTVEGVEAAVECDGGTLAMTFPRGGSPRELVEAFAAMRGAFALTKNRVLAGLL
jgi:hypothetical protein